MADTPRFALPEITGGQAQKHITHNEALWLLDALVHARVSSRSETDPPVSPAEGDALIVPIGGTGVFAGQDGNYAVFHDGGWWFLGPVIGMIIWIADESALAVFDGSDWRSMGDALGADPFETLGINTSADLTNRLAVRSNAALLTALETSGGGSGDIRVVLNKEAVANTASCLFQNGYSGRAEFGIAGDDDFHIKVSDDGVNFTEAVVIDTGGHVGIGAGGAETPLHVTDPDSNRPLRVSSASAASVFMDFTNTATASNQTRIGDASGNLVFYAGGSECLRIRAGGNVGIGVAAPSAPLHVNGAIRTGSFTVAGLPSAADSGAGAMVFVSNESGGAVLAFSDGADWRRSTDRAIVS